MIINKIKLTNFGIFHGQHTINVEPKNGKPVILFGALNGSGKTTLLEGIQIALYGQSARIGFRGKKHYLDYLKSLINNYADQKEGASIEIEFSANIDSKKEIFELKRSWYIDTDKNVVLENSSIRNEKIFNGEETENVNEFIEDLMPSQISNLFFFDGEKIETLAEPSKSKSIIQNGIYSLLGIHDIDNLIKTLQIYEKKKLTDNKIYENQDIQKFDSIIMDLEVNIREIKQERASLRNELNTNDKKIKENQHDLEKNGYDLFKKREEIKKESIFLKSNFDVVQEQLKELSAEKLGLSLVRNQIKDIRNSLTKASGFNISNIGLLENELNEISKAFSDDVKLKGFMDKRLSDLNTIINDVPFDIDEASIPNEQFFTDNEHKCKNILNDYDEICNKLETNERKLAAIPEEEKLQPLIEQENILIAEKDELEIKDKILLKKLDELQKGLEKNRQERENITKAYADSIIESDMEKIKISQSEKSRDNLKKFKAKLVENKVGRIESLITQSFMRLQRKNNRNLIFKINLDDFSLQVNEDDKLLDVSQLSAGEKQLIAISILWALAQASNKTFPSLIDTPLARLDSLHRRNIIENYFPKTSKQVLIFSTDEEIIGEHYQAIKDNTAHEYLIEFDQGKRSSEFKEGYFKKEDSKKENGSSKFTPYIQEDMYA